MVAFSGRSIQAVDQEPRRSCDGASCCDRSRTDSSASPGLLSRRLNSISRVDPGVAANVNNGYTINEYDLGVAYGIPITQEEGAFNRIHVGASYQDTLVNIIPGKASAQVNQFINQHGRRFQEIDLKLGYSRDSRDRAIFPTSGAFQTLFFDGFVPASSQSISFYTANYHGKWYIPVFRDQFILLAKGDLGYGNGFM